METLRFILTNVVLPIAVGILDSFAYPRIESYFKNRSFSTRQRRMNALIAENKVMTYLDSRGCY